MLQEGFELVGYKLLMLLRARLTLLYIPMNWRHVSAVFIPNPVKLPSPATSLRPIRLMSFILKILEKILDRHIRGGILVEKPFHRYQLAYRARMCKETAHFHVVHRLQKSLKHRNGVWVPSGISRGHSTIPLSMRWSGRPGGVSWNKPVACGSGPCLRADTYKLFLPAV
jgi:hypothetical protein